MKILAVETSCDETSIAIAELNNAELRVHAHTTHSQIDEHRAYGGVFPSLAKREHAKNLTPILLETLEKAELASTTKSNPLINIAAIKGLLAREPGLYEQFQNSVIPLERPDIDAIAVTYGPGLEPALWTGINFARALATLWNLPIIPINHLEGHIASCLLAQSDYTPNTSETYTLPSFQTPSVALIVSGGHTELTLLTAWGIYTQIGRTRDDAVGEAFDKVARVLGLDYPGGPALSKLAAEARASAVEPVYFKRPMSTSGDFTFSFSGIKTAVRRYAEQNNPLSEESRLALARGFEDSVVDVLVQKTVSAVEDHTAHACLVTGGVSANSYLRKKLRDTLTDTPLWGAPLPLTGDNALMIALAALLNVDAGTVKQFSADKQLDAIGRLKLGEHIATRDQQH